MTGRIATAMLLLLAGAACTSPTNLALANFHEPLAVAAFQGRTNRYPGSTTAYVAVASARGDELRIIDPVENKPVLSPGRAFPLSIPTLPGPALLAATPLGDGALPDLLVVASAGSEELQVVATWEETSRVGAAVDLLAAMGAGARIVALAAAPAFDAAGAVVPGRARVYVATSPPPGAPLTQKGGIVVVEFARGSDGLSIAEAGAPASHSLTFLPVALAVPLGTQVRNGALVQVTTGPQLYIATPDVIAPSVHGVAEVDTRSADPWTATALDAGGPTTLVAAATVGERTVDAPGGHPVNDPDPTIAKDFGQATLRVYAAMDPIGCGMDQAVACGIATLDPQKGGRAADFVDPTKPRAIIGIPGEIRTMAIAFPPAAGAWDKTANPDGQRADQADGQPLIRLGPVSGTSWTTAVMAVGSATGVDNLVDLGNGVTANDASLLRGGARVQVSSAVAILSAGSTADSPVVGLWAPPAAPTAVTIDSTQLMGAADVWPGFTPDETFTLTWQGLLPTLAGRQAIVGNTGDAVWVGIRTAAGPPEQWASLSDGALGIHEVGFRGAVDGDILAVAPVDGVVNGVACPYVEVPIRGFADPATGAAGGPALLLKQPPQSSETLYCLDPGPGARYVAEVSVLSSGLVLTGAHLGYLGRPAIDTDGTHPAFALAEQDESPGGALATACQGGDRGSCEDLAIARKVRRLFYPADLCDPASTTFACSFFPGLVNPVFPGLAGPSATASALTFRAGVHAPHGETAPVRGAEVVLTTISGMLPAGRRPSPLSIPTSAAALDRSVLAGHENDGTGFYVAYHGDAVLEFAPGHTSADVVTVR